MALFYGMGSMLGGVISPALGGWLTDWLWRAVFLINILFGTLACIGTFLFMPSLRDTSSRFDLFGFAALSLFLASPQPAVDRGQQLDWFDSLEICGGDLHGRFRLRLPRPHLLGEVAFHPASPLPGPELPGRIDHQRRARRARVRRHAADRHHAATGLRLSGASPGWCRHRAGSPPCFR
ncbi:MAG: hypothetical protein R3E09_11355 [Novosphingobium sp.]